MVEAQRTGQIVGAANNPVTLINEGRIHYRDIPRQQNREDEARALLLSGLEIAPDHGPTLHALGLLETRSGQTEKALHYLGRAAALETTGTRHRFIYAIALHDLGKPKEAIEQLLALLRVVPRSEEVLLALANYHAELGRKDRALTYAKTLTDISPRNQSYQQLHQSLGGPK